MKKVFDGMTPDQVWEYIKNLTREEQDKLLFELDDKLEVMKKLTKKGPQYLVNIEFNIPLFNAEKQMYKCISVEEVTSGTTSKTYMLSLNEIKQSYSVPERVDVSLLIPTTDANGELAHINMVEVHEDGRHLPLSNTTTSKQSISSLSGIKTLLYNMAKSI